MSFQRALAEARFNIPQTDRLVRAAGDNELAVSREGHGLDRTTAKSVKKIVLTLLAVLLQRLLTVPVTGP